MLDQLLQVWRDPHARHAALVHIPIALGLLGFLPVLALAFTGFRNRTLKLSAAGLFFIASAGALPAEDAGEDAAENVKAASSLTQVEAGALHDHEELGESGWIWPLIPAGLLLISLVNKKPVRIGSGVLSLAGALGVTVWGGRTGHAGGRLVYIYGLGVPKRGAGSVVLPHAPTNPGEHHDGDLP